MILAIAYWSMTIYENMVMGIATVYQQLITLERGGECPTLGRSMQTH